MNPDDLRLFDRYTILKLDAFSWHLIRRLAEARAARLARPVMSNDVVDNSTNPPEGPA